MKIIGSIVSILITLATCMPATYAYNKKDDEGLVYLSKFSDVHTSDWYAGAVEYCVQNSLMNGTSEDRFSPTECMTRAMLVTTLYRLAGEPEVSENEIPFGDVPSGKWYSAAAAWAGKNGIAAGFADGTFRPDDSITREQTVTILYRYWLLNKSAVGGFEEYTPDYRDAADVSVFAYPAMGWAIENGIIKGTASGLLKPGDFASRAELAAVLMRFCKYGLYIG